MQLLPVPRLLRQANTGQITLAYSRGHTDHYYYYWSLPHPDFDEAFYSSIFTRAFYEELPDDFSVILRGREVDVDDELDPFLVMTMNGLVYFVTDGIRKPAVCVAVAPGEPDVYKKELVGFWVTLSKLYNIKKDIIPCPPDFEIEVSNGVLKSLEKTKKHAI